MTGPPISIPDTATLRTWQRELPAYGLLVEYFDQFPLELLIRFNGLSPEQQQADPRLLPVVGPGQKRPKPGRRRSEEFRLAVAWILMEEDNAKARRDPKVGGFLQALQEHWKVPQDEAIRLSYVPREVTALLDIRLSGAKERSARSQDVQRLRKLQARGTLIPVDLAGLEPMPRGSLERSLWKPLALDKQSDSLTRQGLWTAVFRPLAGTLLRRVPWKEWKEKSWRKACADASRLVHLRYPTLWPDRPELVRNRFEERWRKLPEQPEQPKQ